MEKKDPLLVEDVHAGLVWIRTIHVDDVVDEEELRNVDVGVDEQWNRLERRGDLLELREDVSSTLQEIYHCAISKKFQRGHYKKNGEKEEEKKNEKEEGRPSENMKNAMLGLWRDYC